MRLLTGMLVMGQIGRPDQRINTALVNSRSLTLPDGRRLYYFYQQPDGEIRQTIVVAHGIASSSIFPRGFTDALLESGVAIVGVSRPGYGRSSPLPPEASPLDQFAEDLEHLLDHLQLDRVNLVSMQSGAMFSFAAAAKLKRRIDRMVCIAPILPLSTPEQISALPTGLKILARTKRFFPAFFPLMIESVLKRVDAGEVDVLYRTWYKGVPCDLGVVKDAEARPLLDSWLRFCGAQGGKAYIHDAGLAVSDWSAVVRDSSLPVLFIHGEGDQAVPVDVVRRFIDQHEHIEYHGVPQAGQLAIFVAPELIAQRTIEFLK